MKSHIPSSAAAEFARVVMSRARANEPADAIWAARRLLNRIAILEGSFRGGCSRFGSRRPRWASILPANRSNGARFHRFRRFSCFAGGARLLSNEVTLPARGPLVGCRTLAAPPLAHQSPCVSLALRQFWRAGQRRRLDNNRLASLIFGGCALCFAACQSSVSACRSS